MEKQRCKWCNLKNPVYVSYHDQEWGVPTYDDGRLLEFLILEPFQAGLSWETILCRRESFREAFDRYDLNRICGYGEEKITELLNNEAIIRNRRKIEAAVGNAKVFRDIQREWGSFSDYIWHFTDGNVVYESGRTSSALSDAVTRDMKKRGMTFVGTTTIYAYLQAVGIIYSHDPDCFLYKKGKTNSIPEGRD